MKKISNTNKTIYRCDDYNLDFLNSLWKLTFLGAMYIYGLYPQVNYKAKQNLWIQWHFDW